MEKLSRNRFIETEAVLVGELLHTPDRFFPGALRFVLLMLREFRDGAFNQFIHRTDQAGINGVQDHFLLFGSQRNGHAVLVPYCRATGPSAPQEAMRRFEGATGGISEYSTTTGQIAEKAKSIGPRMNTNSHE
jgi:hypothetical protein